uniref:Uncharacterized protein n=1 Tax=Pristionchus pacificus TaxID=54126 RepID=A0A2A6BQZ3_PRIPA|eukprot:PDM68213.1 hypothetical protein PRIPAC_46257 [Pristionchus pacificus]
MSRWVRWEEPPKDEEGGEDDDREVNEGMDGNRGNTRERDEKSDGRGEEGKRSSDYSIDGRDAYESERWQGQLHNRFHCIQRRMKLEDKIDRER